ncbi:unnamed protein product [Cladocopium goreaui]|uniref:Uncharacterized protein n=1 Tax=Cladocopium goreaui TaxID=2562237 RepID=A0A9P1FTR5_9DINO|nr:unnamed protein product [Cladocopium goreaui]
MAAVPEEAEKRRLFAAARKAAKDSLVEIDIQKHFCDVVRSGLLMEELEHAFSFTQTNLDGKHAKGEGCPTRPVADVKGKTGKMTVGGSLGYLKLSSRACVAVNPKRIELAMLQWNKKPIDLNRILRTIEINADNAVWTTDEYKDMVAAACLPCYWLKDEEHIIYWLADSLTDVVFCLSPQGTGADFLLKKFSDYEEEEKKRNVLGCRRKVLTCEDWSADTVKRYVAVARKLESQPQLVQTILQLEFELGRDSALDGITALRSLVGLNLEETDAVFVVNIVGVEQRCGFRRKGSVVPMRHCKGNFDIAVRLKSMLIRRDLFKHLAGLFKRFESEILSFMEASWYKQFIGSQQEAEGCVEQPEDDGDMKVEVSAFASKGPVIRFCTKLAKGHFELSLCKITLVISRVGIRKESVPGKSLNLTKDDALQKQVEACREKHATDFPPEPPVTQKQSMVRHEFLEVTTTAEIESDAHYLEELSRFNIQATQHEARVIQEYMDARVEWLIWQNGTDGRLERLPLLREASAPKVLLYEAQNDGMIDFEEDREPDGDVGTIQQTSTPEMKDKSCLCIMCKVDNLKTKSALDIIRTKIPKKAASAIITLDPEQTDLLSRIRLALASHKGFATAASTMKHLKAIDTFFNRWPVPLIPIGNLKVCKVAEYDLMFRDDTTTDRLHEECFCMLSLVLTQEILHVFSAGVLVAAGISSGLSVLGGLLGGARVVAICSSKSHQKYVQKNVTQWLKEKKLVHSCSSGNRRKDVVARAQRPSQWRPRPIEAAHPQLRMLVPVSAQAPMEAAQAQLRMLVLQVPMEDQGGVCWVPLEMFRCEAAS